MTHRIKKNLYSFIKAVNYSTFLRKKKLSYIKANKIKQLNMKLKLQFTNYKIFDQLFKYISIYNNFKYHFNFNPIFI